ncbi:transporter substrate-binding domain-containing protein [Roseovarius aestuarii]|nr:transporter substrate-binding domain-containing protein [Roseovarius aestuarii]
MGRMMWRRALIVLVMMVVPGAALALCDVTYKVQPGDTLRTIAKQHYSDAENWTLIYYANLSVINNATQEVPAGANVFVPCPAGRPKEVLEPLIPLEADMTLLTGGNYAPFTDRNWPGNGMMFELVNAALGQSPSRVRHSVIWVNDWSQHLFPLLDGKTYDMGFPWVRPDCAATPESGRCARFHYSDPFMDLPIMLFKRADGEFQYESDADVPGHSLCRPKGYFIHDLDRPDRRWIRDNKITLTQPDTPEECFELLMAGTVDAVTVNVFLGATKIVKMGLRGRVVPLDKPLSQEALYVVISKTHWRATAFLYRLNAGLRALRASGRYDEIIARHMAIFEDQLK